MPVHVPSTIHVSFSRHPLYYQHVFRVIVRMQAQTVIRKKLHYTVIDLEI